MLSLPCSRKGQGVNVAFRAACAVTWLLWLIPGTVSAQPREEHEPPPKVRCVPVEIYVRGGEERGVASAQSLRERLSDRRGTVISILDIDEPENLGRFQQICRAFRVQQEKLPLVYVCRQIVSDCGNPDNFCANVEATMRMTVFVREGCSRCASAKEFLPSLQPRFPGIQIKYREIISSQSAREELDRLTRLHRKAATSIPVFHFCNQLVVGFDRESTTGKRIEQILNTWTVDCPAPPREKRKQRPLDREVGQLSYPPATAAIRSITTAMLISRLLTTQTPEPDLDSSQNADTSGLDTESSEEPVEQLPLPLAPLPLPDSPLPGPTDGQLPPTPLPDEDTLTDSQDRIDLPVFGELSSRTIGLPLFTVAVGLVDGFNPCAMWVLLFLLSVLVNLRDRWKIVAVAGTFVLISGAAYFAFMAAWLNVFLLVGYLRWVQVMLGSLAIGIGSIHIKDFFAFKQGLSLSIPESAKPGLYARVRRIVSAESLSGAVMGASVLAVLVNIIELLCTAGLPALYTEILTMHGLEPWQNYGYLLLYNLAYMFDDGVMVTLVVVTLGRRKMQETHGRWLKLLSGSVIAALGVVMILKPEWLG